MSLRDTEADDRSVHLMGTYIGWHEHYEIRGILMEYGPVDTVRKITGHNYAQNEPTVAEAIVTFSCKDGASEAREALASHRIVDAQGVIWCTPETWDTPCPCSFKSDGSCHGERCRNENHKMGCQYCQCIGCFGDSDSQYS